MPSLPKPRLRRAARELPATRPHAEPNVEVVSLDGQRWNLPLTLIASVFGMSLEVPGEGSIEAFWVILASMVLMLGGMLGFFRWRGWL